MTHNTAEDVKSLDTWLDTISAELAQGTKQALQTAEEALEHYPTDPDMLVAAAFAALVAKHPDDALMYVKRKSKRYVTENSLDLCKAIAFALKNKWFQARSLLESNNLFRRSYSQFLSQDIAIGVDLDWIDSWIARIKNWTPQQSVPRQKNKTPSSKGEIAEKVAPLKTLKHEKIQELQPPASTLPAVTPRLTLTFAFSDEKELSFLESEPQNSIEDFFLRRDLAQLSLLKGFDELLCLSTLRDIDKYHYQLETAKKVLRDFRGRVLLADEVGLGKTIEAGMILKEYLMRGMVKRVLVLVPSSLVRQWQEELETKFSINSLSTTDSLFRRDPQAFWQAPCIIASMATAKRPVNQEMLAREQFDIVIVDEAHHLKNRRTKAWELVDSLQKRFLLLLSATPVQNNLIELYNLLTLLKPGIFQTEKEFRAAYMVAGKPRLPANRESLQMLMRDVMIRNTRALVDVHLPPRHALTVRMEPSSEERECYEQLSSLVRGTYERLDAKQHMSLRHLLGAAGSSPAAAAGAIERFLKHYPIPGFEELLIRYSQLTESVKMRALFELLEKNPSEKKIVFVHFRDTLHLLSRIFTERNISFTQFDGEMTAAEKDASIERFRSSADVLLSTESGGEGRNLQFCNTLINFDLPWNPQTIEQRIGRIHRIGQQREVFIFNLTTQGTLEDYVLKILDEKLNMFELVVGEIQCILGELDSEGDFSHTVFSTWVEATQAGENVFDNVTAELLEARKRYEASKVLDQQLFGEEFEAV